jgi:hypothetical protein
MRSRIRLLLFDKLKQESLDIAPLAGRGRFASKMRCGRATLHESVWRFYYDPAMIKKTAGPVS